MRIDVVFPVIEGGSLWDDLELKFALRAWCKNFSRLGRIVIVGFKPPWVQNVVHIPFDDARFRNKDANIIDKLVAACKFPVSEKFVRCSDDELPLSPCTPADLMPRHSVDLAMLPEESFNTPWRLRLLRTARWLTGNGFTAYHYDTHTPKLYDRTEVLRIASNSEYIESPGFTVDTWLCNQSNIPRVKGMSKLAVVKPVTLPWLRANSVGKMFLSYSEEGATETLFAFLEEKFPEKCRFEAGSVEPVRVKKKVIAVLGPGRSGTSAVAGMLSRLGVDFGPNLRKPDHRNLKGYFESLHVKRILDYGRNKAESLRRWADSLRGPIVGIKNPGLSEGVSLLRQAWPDLSIVWVDRSTMEVVESFADSGFHRRNLAELLIMVENRRAAFERDSKGLRCLRLRYDEVVSDPVSTAEKLQEFAGTTGDVKFAADFIDERLWHYRLCESSSLEPQEGLAVP